MSVSRFMIQLGQDSLQAGVLVLVVLLAQKALGKRLTARWRSGLWLLVMVRLLLLVSLGSVVSVFNLLPQTHARNMSSVSIDLTAPPSAVPDASRPLRAEAVATEAAAQPQRLPASNGFESVQPPPREHVIAVVSPYPKRMSWSDGVLILFRVWLAGVVSLLVYIVTGSLSIQRHLSRLSPVSDPHLLELLAECTARMQIRGDLDLVESPRVATPGLHGFLRPKLLLPPGFTAKFSSQELRFVLLHELAHVKRRDILFNWLAAVLQAIHWFNPLIWFGFARWRADRELACDALALEASGADQNRAYGRTILRLLDSYSPRAAMPGLVGILEDKRQLRQRIVMIANYVPAKKWPLAAALLVGLLAIVGLTDAQNNTPGSAPAGNKAHVANTALPPRPVVTDGREIKVTVLDAETGKPLPNAEVLSQNTASYFSGVEYTPHWFTDKDGVATIHLGKTFSDPARMQTWFTLSARHRGYSARGWSWSGSDQDVRLTVPDTLTLRLPRGIVAGGVVRDEAGHPVAAVHVRVFGTDQWKNPGHENSEFWSDSVDTPAVTTDASGHWVVTDFPADIQVVRIELTRPGGAMQRFVQEGEQDEREPGNPVNLDELKAKKAVFVLPEGRTIRGSVVDQNGKAIGGALLKARAVTTYPSAPYAFTNNPDGSFELRNLSADQVLIRAEAADYATKTVTVTPAQKSSDIQIVLPPAIPLRLRVVGENGEPIAGAVIQTLDWRNRNQLLDWSGQTDDHGLLVWSNPPAQEVAIQIGTSNYPPRTANLLPDGTEKTIRLSKETSQSVTVHLHPVDADSGKPLKTFDVFRNLQWWGQGFKGWGDPGRDGEFQKQVDASEFRAGTALYFVLQIRVEGYAPWTQECYFEDGDMDVVPRMKKSPVPGGVVLQPDGKPAKNASVLLNIGMAPIFMNIPYSPDIHFTAPDDGTLTKRTGEDGSFHFEAADDDKDIVIMHPSGFLSLTVGELTRAHEVRLQPWASVEGILRVNGKPLVGETVNIMAPLSWNDMVEPLAVSLQAKTDQEGHFNFTNLPPGYYALIRTPHPVVDAYGMNESHRLVFELQPGEHKELDYGFGGRDVVGRVHTTVPVDWQHDAQMLVAKVPRLPPAPRRWVYASESDFKNAKLAYDRSPETLAAQRNQQEFQLVFDADGNFRADDVPPGTYELRLRLTKPPEFGQPRIPSQELVWGSLKQDVVVPAGQGAFDVGSLTMSVNPEAAIKTVADKPTP